MSWYIGLDPASSVAGIAAISETGELRSTTLTAKGQMPDRLVYLRAQARAWLRFAADEGAWCAVIEIPKTPHGGATMFGAYGVLVEAVRSILPCPVQTLLPQQIDELALGRRSLKNQRKQNLITHARLLGWDGTSQDEADALVCADAARVLSRQIQKGAA